MNGRESWETKNRIEIATLILFLEILSYSVRNGRWGVPQGSKLGHYSSSFYERLATKKRHQELR